MGRKKGGNSSRTTYLCFKPHPHKHTHTYIHSRTHTHTDKEDIKRRETEEIVWNSERRGREKEEGRGERASASNTRRTRKEKNSADVEARTERRGG